MVSSWIWQFLITASGFINLGVHADLRPGGINVCSQTESYNTYEARQFTRIGYDNYRTCCKRFLGICTSRCTRYRTRVETYYNNVLVVRYKPVYFCCSGWARSGDQCTLPICNPGCVYGDCVQPNVCQCRSGYTGSRCEADIDECQIQPPRCQQICNNLSGTYACSCRAGYMKTDPTPTNPSCVDVNECATNPCQCAAGNPGCVASCHNSDGSFSCSCSSGFQLANGPTICFDVDECASSSTNNCQQICMNRPGSYSCSCRSGYVLLADGRSCQDVDECATLNGGCNQVCKNEAGSYHCECVRGYRLSGDKHSCADIDECFESKPCDQKEGICTNVLGSYKCSCKVGFALLTDQKTCVDVDECSDSSLNGCQQNCHNAYGTYTCSCNVGYRLDPDLRKCNDIDECVEGSNKCSHNCHNNVGSYTCSCRPGYKLEADGLTCTGLPCETITAPEHGKMTCSGFVTDQSCHFHCDDGFDLVGSDKRVCQPSATWSGFETSCTPKSCPALQPPPYGSVVIPCVEFFGSTCLLRCSRGYYIVGSSSSECVVDDKKATTWLPLNATCLETKACTPNPCRHSGICTEVKDTTFRCDCSSTGYTGRTCERGVLSTSAFPELTVDEVSEELTVTAQPDDVLELVPEVSQVGALVFEPSKLYLKNPRREASFKVTAKLAGVVSVSFKLQGTSAADFDPPQAFTVYAVAKRLPTPPVDVTHKVFSAAPCNQRQVKECGSGGPVVSLMSTCRWEPSTIGFVSAQSPKVNVPLSPVGISDQTMSSYFGSRFVDPAKEVGQFLKTRQIPNVCPNWAKCPGIQLTSDSANFLIDYDYFQHVYFQSIAALLPSWAKISPDSTQHLFAAENVKAVFGEGRRIRSVVGCESLDLQDDQLYVAYTPTMPLVYKLLSWTAVLPRSSKPACFVANMCAGTVAFSLPEGATLDFGSTFNALGVSQLQANARAMAFFDKSSDCFKFKTEVSCFLQPSVGTRLAGKYRTSLDKLLVVFDGDLHVEFADNDLALINKFDSEVKFAFEGSLDYTVTMKVLGEQLVIKDSSPSATARFIGCGRKGTCPACEADSGVWYQVAASADSFQYASAVFKFSPRSEMSIRHVYDISGGSVIGIDNMKRVSLQVRGLTQFSAQLQSLLGLLALNYSQDASLVSSRGADMMRKVDELLAAVESSNATFEALADHLSAIDPHAFDLVTSLKSLKRRLGVDSHSVQIGTVSEGIIRRLSALSRLELLPTSTDVQQKDNGVQLRYEGGLCIHKLCLADMNVNVFDVINLDVDKDCDLCAAGALASGDKLLAESIKDSVIIVAKSSVSISLGDRISFAPDSSLRMYLKKESSEFTGVMTVSLRLFEGNYATQLLFSNEQVRFSVKDVKVGSAMTVNIEGSVPIATASWSSIVYKITGSTYDHVDVLTGLAQDYFVSTAADTMKRLRRSTEKVNETENNLRKAEQELDLAKASLDKASSEWRERDVRQKWLLKSLNGNQTEMNSYLPDLGPLFIEKNVESVCALQTCAEQCLSMPVCNVCQDPVSKDVDTLKCDPVTQTIRTSGLAPYKTDCDVTRYQFIPVYTGSCSISAGEQAAHQADFQKSLVATGSGVGALVGSVIPGVGTAVGAAVGAVVGFIGGLFSSCDKSYEVITRKWVEQEPCTLMRMQVTTVTRDVSECYYVKTTVLTGYDAPRECDCKTNPCVAKVKDTDCLLGNFNCEKQRRVFLENTASVPQKFTDLFTRIQTLRELVDAASIEEVKYRNERDFYEREYNKLAVFARNMKQEAIFATQSHKASDDVLTLGTCLAAHVGKTPDLTSLFSVKRISFDVNLPVVDNIQLNADIYNEITKVPVTFPFVYDLSDPRLSLYTAAKKMVNQLLCGKARKRRAVDVIDVSVDQDLPFTSWYIDNAQNASGVQSACLTFQKITSFLNFTVHDLILLADEAIELERIIQLPANDAIAKFVGYSSGDSLVVSAQRELVNNLLENTALISKGTTVGQVQRRWRQNAEVFTSYNNYTFCLTFDDCIDVAYESLMKLPTILSVPRPVYEQVVNETVEIYRAFAESRISSLAELAKKAKGRLNQIYSIALHCEKKPEVKPTLPEKLAVQAGHVVRLVCEAASRLPVKFYWFHHGALLDRESNSELKFVASLESAGVYSCMAWSLTGNSTSKGTEITVYQKPHLLQQPVDVSYFIPSEREIRPSFACNVTSHPESDIEWYFTDFSGVTSILRGERTAVLTIVSPVAANAGFYSCKASNTFGAISSRKARLDVLGTVLASQSLNLTLAAAVLSNVSSASFAKLVTEIRADPVQSVNLVYAVDQILQQGVVTLSIRADPLAVANATSEEFLRIASISRQNLASTAANFISHMLLKKSNLLLEDGRLLQVDNDSVAFQSRQNICRAGYLVHENGYLCGQCPVGTAGSDCRACRVSSYQPQPGQAKCIACGGKKVTERAGSTKESDCVDVQNEPSDIVFLVDQSHYAISRQQAYLTSFYSTFNPGPNIRFAIIGYSSWHKTYMTLSEYGGRADFQNAVLKLHRGRGWRYVYHALAEAGALLRNESSYDRKRFVIVITDGRATGSYHLSGFALARRESLKLRHAGVKIISVSVGRRGVDLAELMAISSHPRSRTVLLADENIESTTASLIKEMLQGLNGKSKSADIAFMYEPVTFYNSLELSTVVSEIEALVTSTFHSNPSSKIALIPPRYYHQDHDSEFRTYGDQESLLRHIRAWMHDFVSYQEVKSSKRLRDSVTHVLNERMTEDWGSMDESKVLVVISRKPVTLDLVKGVDRFYEERIFIANFAIEYSENVPEVLVTGHAPVYRYGLYQVKKFLEQLENMKE